MKNFKQLSRKAANEKKSYFGIELESSNFFASTQGGR